MWWKRLVLYTLHRTFPKIILVWNLFKQISVFLKLTILKTLKLFFVKALDGMKYPIKSFCYLSSLAKSTNKTKISLVFFIMKKNLWWKRLVLCTLHRTFPKIILVWNLFKQISVFFKIDNFKNTKIIFGAVRKALDGILKVSHQILVSAICRAWQSRQIKLISLVFSSWRKICDEKDLFYYLTQNVSKNNFGLKFVQTNFSVFKIDNFKNTKIILALSRRLMGYLKYPIKS